MLQLLQSSKKSSYEVDIVNEENLSGCIFDIDNQTDDFLKGIDLFKGYVWDDEEKTATLKLESGEVVKIHKGGCDYFSVSTTIEVIGDMKSFTMEHFIKHFHNIASKLPKDFKYDDVKKELLTKNYSVENYDRSTSWYFNDEYLQMSNYYFSLEQIDNKVHFSFGWYMN